MSTISYRRLKEKKEEDKEKDRNEQAPRAAFINDVPFSVLTKLIEELRSARLQKRKRNMYSGNRRTHSDERQNILMRNWLQICKHVNSAYEKLSSHQSNGADEQIIPAHLLKPEDSIKVIGLLVPELDATHGVLGMKETKLAEAFIKALDLTMNSEDAQWLKNYKEKAYRPLKFKQDATVVDGDLPTIIQAVLRGRCKDEKSTLTIGLVWDVLNLLSSTSKMNKRIGRMEQYPDEIDETHIISSKVKNEGTDEEKKYNALVTLVQNGTSKEVAEVTRIILKDLNVRLTRDNFLSWFHPAAKQHFTQVHNVPKMLKDCYDPQFDIGDAAVQLGQYASVMLTMRPTRRNLATICEKLKGGVGEGVDTFDNKSESALPVKKEESLHTEEKRNEIKAEEEKGPYFIMEPKLDGERLQLHKWKTPENKEKSGDSTDENIQLRTFSRQGNDSTRMYADALFQVVCEGVRAQDVILDGEIMLWDDLRHAWVPFEKFRTITTAISSGHVPEGESYTLKYMVFDVLFVQQSRRGGAPSGNMVMRLPLSKRRELLSKLIPKAHSINYISGCHAVVEVVPMEKGRGEQALVETLQRYETLGNEGVVAKNPDKPYVLAERSLDIAIKLKPDYFDGGIQDVDVLILGAKHSSGRGNRAARSGGKLSSFLIGVRDDDLESSAANEPDIRRAGRWTIVGSVGTGYSDSDLTELQSRLRDDWRDLDTRSLPDHFQQNAYPPAALSGVAKWIAPWKSVVVTIKAFELNRRLNMLRFPRVSRIRWDKPYYDVASFADLCDQDDHKMPAFVAADEADDDDVLADSGEPTNRKRSRQSAHLDHDELEALRLAREQGIDVRGGRRLAVDDAAVGASISNVPVDIPILRGIVAAVAATHPAEKATTELMLHRLGARFVQNVTPDVDFVVTCDDTTARTHPAATSRHPRCSVVSSAWVHACATARTRVPVRPEWVVAASPALHAEVFRECDRFGDPWRANADMDAFRKALTRVDETAAAQPHVIRAVKPNIWAALDDCEVRCTTAPLRGVVMLVLPCLRLAGSTGLVRAFGGRVVRQLGDDVTHVLFDGNTEKGGAELEGINWDIVKKVDATWIREQVDQWTTNSPSTPT